MQGRLSHDMFVRMGQFGGFPLSPGGERTLDGHLLQVSLSKQSPNQINM